MLGAILFNQSQNNNSTAVYGCVTTGEIWQFLELEKQTVSFDNCHYYINHLNRIIGILQTIVERN